MAIIGNINLYGICYGDGKYVGVGNNGIVTYSTNGVDWTVTQLTSSYNLYGICPA